MTNWNDALLRCSCIGKVMTNGKGSFTEKQGELLKELENKPKRTEKQSETLAELILKRDAPPKLGDTCTSYLREVYQLVKYGKESVGGSQRSVYTIKGHSMEDESIMVLSRLYGVPFAKNEERFRDDDFSGEMDILWPEKRTILDTKSVWDMESLLSHIPDPESPQKELYDDAYEWQGHGYMELKDFDEHHICYVLVNMPQEIIEKEKFYIFKAMNPTSEEDTEYLRKIRKLEDSMTFDEIPIEERIVRFIIKRDKEKIKQVREKWAKCRKWLADFEYVHMNLHKKYFPVTELNQVA